MKSNPLLVALCFAFAPAVLSAQNEAAVSMQIDVVAWGDSIRGLSFKAGEKEGQITARAFTYSEPVHYKGPRILAIHKSGNGGAAPELPPMTAEDKEHQSVPLEVEESANLEPTGTISKSLAKRREKEPTLVALVPLPTGARRVTVLLAPAAEGTYQAYVINDDPSKLPPGKLRVHNLSGHTIGMKFSGGQKTVMKPGETFLARAAQGQAIYQLSYQTGSGKWKVQENNIIPVRADEQTQFIVLQSTNQFFLSADGASGGFLQAVTLRREAR